MNVRDKHSQLVVANFLLSWFKEATLTNFDTLTDLSFLAFKHFCHFQRVILPKLAVKILYSAFGCQKSRLVYRMSYNR